MESRSSISDGASDSLQLQMKTRCGKCGTLRRGDAQAYICSFECTFCYVCAAESQGNCPNCSGELVRRPRRSVPVGTTETTETAGLWADRPWLIWVLSFGVWTLISLAATGSIYELWRSRGYPMSFITVLMGELSQSMPYAPLTPFVLALALRFPLQRGNWVRRSLLHLSFGILFSMAHIILRGLTPYAFWDAKLGSYISAVWNPRTHGFEVSWPIFRTLFLSNVVDDITGTYIPIVLIAHVVSYYRRLRDRELHSAKLETQLAISHLQVLKSHLQPHFLFNTMHSISALMLTDVEAADRMMARLSDLLRMSLDSAGTQITALSRELEFVDGYLEIEKVKFGDRLKVIRDIAAETLGAQVPSLLLQPLVENAIRHGIARLSAGGRVWISASRDRSHVHLNLSVRNDGPSLNHSDKATSGSGLGLRTTKERLQTLYGKEQELEIHDVPGGGVEVCVRIPFRIEPQEFTNADEVLFVERKSNVAVVIAKTSGLL